jgi:preprotein translocase subunit SecB
VLPDLRIHASYQAKGIQNMAKQPKNGAQSDVQDDAAAAQSGPALSSLTQYVKDFSFENPNAPRSLGQQQQGPQISLQVNVGAQPLSDTDYESTLVLEGKAMIGAEVLFQFELTYSGVFRLTGIPQEQIHPVIMIECPRLLFPFARQIVADAVRNGGFPPLYVDPIDFAALYQQRVQEIQSPAANTPVS